LLIQNSLDLARFIKDLGAPPYVTVDTEFISEKTYYPQLCLIQLAYGSHAAVIDPLSGLDLEPLIKFLRNPQIIKVFHAAEQDLAILWNNFSFSPTPVFDTQIAAMVCGFGDQVSYGHLVKIFTSTRLDKSAQIMDWSQRPLLDRHIEYALADVSNLGIVYERLYEEIHKRNRAGWIDEEMRELSDPGRFGFNLETQMSKLKMKKLSRRGLATLRELIIWREERAKTQDIPRGWVLKDLALRDLVFNQPKNLEELGRIRSIGGNSRGQIGQEIIQCIRTSKALPLAECPPFEEARSENESNENAVVLLRALLKHVCEKNKVAPRMVATRADLEEMTMGVPTRVARGWRFELFGDLAQKLLSGMIALALVDGEIEIVKIK